MTSPSGSDRELARLLICTTCLVTVLGLVSEIARYTLSAPHTLVDFFSLSVEGNLPTWYASSLLLLCGRELLHVARRRARTRAAFARHWLVLGALFLFMSLDEAVELHEHLAGVVAGRGALYFSWVIPASAIVAVLGLAFTPFLAHLPAADRRRFLVAGALYVGGALVFELPLGYFTERHGTDNLGYALIDFCEETLELVGAACFLLAVRTHRITHA